MSDTSKKRSNSFRKLFPRLLFSSKPKEKVNKDSQIGYKKNVVDNSSISNQYENPRTVIDNVDTNENGRIYENLTVRHYISSSCNIASSNNSSSSTLVSESAKAKQSQNYDVSGLSTHDEVARPQVPRKPYNELHARQVVNHIDTYSNKEQYPDVYYHSVEKLTETITPLDEIKIYRAVESYTKPASVGAEIKRVSTKFLISPKKEAEVRTIQPTRARSFSLEKEKIVRDSNLGKSSNKREEVVKKSYNYSAPTSPIPTNHKIPNMPKTVSPYGHVRKSMNEAEEKKNSLNRTSSNNKFLQTVTPDDSKETNTIKNENVGLGGIRHKEKARQKLEAFYWQKLRELKHREDEYLLKHSFNSSLKGATPNYATNSNTNHSLPYSFKTTSLPREVKGSPVTSSPFVRGVAERRTDTFISNKGCLSDVDIIYRHPEKLHSSNSVKTDPREFTESSVFQRGGSLKPESRSFIFQPKRVSFEEKLYVNESNNTGQEWNSASEGISRSKRMSQMPPRPPVRTTSVSRSSNHYRINNPTSYLLYSESESGSEAGEIQRILQSNAQKEDDWHGDGSRIDGGLSDGEASRGPARVRGSRRDDPRRHTLAGNHLYVHPHHPPQINSHEMELLAVQGRGSVDAPEYATVNKNRGYCYKQNPYIDPCTQKPPLGRGYPPPSNALLFDDDPGIMSEVETSSTGFRRGGKQRSSLPVVRTPSKTLERPLGLVFLQYRNETKRALLPNEITSIDTVKALFVRSFPKQLSMQYMDSPLVKIYIHDSSKDMFYELEDVRAHLRDIRDRSVLRLFEATDMGGGVFPGAVGVGSLAMPPGAATCSGPPSWEQDQSYFSEPEIDSEYHHQHVHKTKVKAPAYYMGTAAPSTLPRGGSLLRAYSPAAPPVPADRAGSLPSAGPTTPAKPLRTYVPGSGSERCFPFAADYPRGPEQLYTMPGLAGEGYPPSPERGASRAPYEDPYYTQFLGPSARPNVTPVIDEESSEGVIIDDAYQMYGVAPITTAPRPMPRPPYDARLNPQVEDIQRLRVEKMERQLANLTGLVQKALQVPGGAPGGPGGPGGPGVSGGPGGPGAPAVPAAPAAAPRQQFHTYQSRTPNQDAARFPSNDRPPKLGRDKFQKSVSFEKSVSFSDDPPDMNSPIQHSPQHSADTKPTKPAIKSSTLPRTSSQERDRLKPAPPPKPAGLVGQQLALVSQKVYTINVTPDFFNDMRVLQKQSRDLRIETRNLRRSTLSHAIQMRQLMADTIVKIGALAASFYERDPDSQLTREEEIYRQDMLLLENDLYELEATVERLRGQAANRETRVNMADVERIAMVLSKSSKTVADWKLKFPILQDTMKLKLASEMEKVVRKEKMLEEEPERLELALRRCKKLTGTLVTLKRLACVQEQRLPAADGRASPGSSQGSCTAGPSSEECDAPPPSNKGTGGGRGAAPRGAADVRPENALDALLDELQTFAKPGGGRGEPPLRRLHSYPSGSDTDASPPVRARGQHPPKPPVPERHPELLALAARRAPPPPPPPPRTTSRSPLASPTSPCSPPRADSSPPEPDLNDDKSLLRQSLLEQRHQELLKKQKALQEQYARLQMIQRSGPTLPTTAQPDLKKTGSESNLLTKLNLNLATATISGSMTHLACQSERAAGAEGSPAPAPALEPLTAAPDTVATTNKVYETDIL